MGKNRKMTKKMSVVAGTAMNIGFLIMVIFIVAILNLLATSSCQQLVKGIGEKEREIAKLDDAITREAMRWEEMTTPDKIEMRLLKLGIGMSMPRPEQQVRLRADGTPYPGQCSLARLKGNGVEQTAQYSRKKKRR